MVGSDCLYCTLLCLVALVLFLPKKDLQIIHITGLHILEFITTQLINSKTLLVIFCILYVLQIERKKMLCSIVDCPSPVNLSAKIEIREMPKLETNSTTYLYLDTKPTGAYTSNNYFARHTNHSYTDFQVEIWYVLYQTKFQLIWTSSFLVMANFP